MLHPLISEIAVLTNRAMYGISRTTLRAFSMEGVRGYTEKEAVEERLYFSKEDERALRNLLLKAKKQADRDELAA